MTDNERLNPFACAMHIPPRSMELKVTPNKTNFNYMLRFEKAGSSKFVYFEATLGDLEQFIDELTEVVRK